MPVSSLPNPLSTEFGTATDFLGCQADQQCYETSIPSTVRKKSRWLNIFILTASGSCLHEKVRSKFSPPSETTMVEIVSPISRHAEIANSSNSVSGKSWILHSLQMHGLESQSGPVRLRNVLSDLQAAKYLSYASSDDS